MTSNYRNAILMLAMTCTLVLARPARAASLLEPQLAEDDNYSETLTTIADLEDGTYVQVQLNISNLGMGDANGGCRILVVEPNQKTWTASDRVSRDKWSATSTALTITTCSVTSAGGGTTAVSATLDGGSVKLTIAADMKARTPPDANLKIEDKTYANVIAVAWAKVEASLSVPGRAARKLGGFAYMDHSRSTTLPAQLATRWVRFRALGPGDSLLVLARNLPDGTLRGWAWREKEPFARPLTKLKLTRVDAKDQAKGYTIEGAAGDMTFTIAVESQLYRYAPVEEFGVLGMLARSVVGNPVTRTYRATLDAQPATLQNAKRGILEVQHVQ